ncbi:hypothetical protein J7T55_001320 [Diaporthe amygdali]|uniref:uncharacterized protein n=1 Tax=Phomopsis amygdali TaxID=1214568 RepID=UPI0022FDF4A5|nr:uncharacterized protein J7T55_001320 [Diaporthe amygdali]KAJ0106796.1 hypothetical protein J7T55_001320 [Diaporthe amygdali]
MAALLAEGVWNRKAGRYDYNRFDHIASTSASVGYQSIGKVGVDCRFLFRKSQWGTLGPAENAAGIIYMELNFDQPPDCTLESATIQVTLDEDDQGLDPYRVDSLPASECPVLITDYYGPGHIVGTSKRVLVNEVLKFEPYINVGGNGGSLGGTEKEKKFEHESRWMFRSHRVRDYKTRGQKWGHRILRWEMTENNIEKYPVHSNKVFTAFAYEHSGQPFLMKVEVSGKLRQRSDRLKANLARNLKKFGPRARRQEEISTTLVGAYLGHRRPLDELAKGLASAMEVQNYLAPPLVMPDTQTASFQQVTFDETPSTNPAAQYPCLGTSNQEFLNGRTSQPALNLDGHMLNMVDDIQVSGLQDRTEPTLENLARVGEYFTAPIRQEAIRSDSSEASAHPSATTLVASSSGTPRSVTSLPQKIDGDTMARVMEISFLRLLIQLVVGIMDFLVPKGAPIDATGGK